MFELFEKMFEAERIVQERQSAIVTVLKKAQIPFALFASNATYVWIESVDPSCVRQYRNVEFLVNRQDSSSVDQAMESLGLKPEPKADHVLLRNHRTSRDRWSDRAYFAKERLVGSNVVLPSIEAVEIVGGIPVISLRSLVEFQLSRFKLDDDVDLRDLIDTGLVDQTWTAILLPELAERLQEILDTPEG